MFIKINAWGITIPDLIKEHAEGKVRLMLGLYSEKIRRVDIYLSDVNGPKGGRDMSCKIKVTINTQQPIVVESRAERMKEAIDICSHRVKRNAARRFKRAMEKRRTSIKFISDDEQAQPA